MCDTDEWNHAKEKTLNASLYFTNSLSLSLPACKTAQNTWRVLLLIINRTVSSTHSVKPWHLSSLTNVFMGFGGRKKAGEWDAHKHAVVIHSFHLEMLFLKPCPCIRFNILNPCSRSKTWLFCAGSKLQRVFLTFFHHLRRPMGQDRSVQDQIRHCTCSGTTLQSCVCVCVYTQ